MNVDGKPGMFEDEMIKAAVGLQNWQITLQISNKESSPIRVLWPDARIYWDRSEDALQLKSQGEIPELTPIQAGAKADLRVFPRPMLRWMGAGKPGDATGFWTTTGARSRLFCGPLSEKSTDEERRAFEKGAIGQVVAILLPIEHASRTNVYFFQLTVTSARTYPARF